MSRRISDRTAIVTGAAQGIGYAIAERLGEEGASVVLADRRRESGEMAAADLKGQGTDAMFVACDVTSRTDTKRLVADTIDQFDGIDILVNNAGIAHHTTFPDLEPDAWDDVIGTNLTGAFNCLSAVTSSMIEREYGRVVNVSSMAGRTISYHAGADYTASKWGLIGLTKHAAWDLGEHDITVNAVCPGSTLTPLTEAATTPDERTDTARKIPLGRWATPEDQANGVLYLVSEAGSYLTGTVLEIDGGKQLSVRYEI